MIPTIEEYKKAKEIVTTYEAEQTRLYNIRVEAFKVEVQQYFDDNLLDGVYYLKEFKLRIGDFGNGEIIPINPSMEERYCGGNDEDIEKLCKKHNVYYKIVYWSYPK